MLNALWAADMPAPLDAGGSMEEIAAAYRDSAPGVLLAKCSALQIAGCKWYT